MRKDALFVHRARSHLVVQHIGSVGHSDIPQHAHCDHTLLQMDGLIFAGNQVGHLLIAGGDVSLAETSTNKGDSTSSRPYWSRSLTAVAHVSSIFWNS